MLQTTLREQENGNPQKSVAEIEVRFEVTLDPVSHEGRESEAQPEAGTKLVLPVMLFAGHRIR